VAVGSIGVGGSLDIGYEMLAGIARPRQRGTCDASQRRVVARHLCNLRTNRIGQSGATMGPPDFDDFYPFLSPRVRNPEQFRLVDIGRVVVPHVGAMR
jgi:hypothetical protein